MLKKTYRLRLNLLYLLPFLFMPILFVRLFIVQVKDKEIYEKEARIQHFKKHTLIPSRGKIVDRNGNELAGSIMLDHAYIEQRHLGKAKENALPELAKELADLLGTNNADIIYKKMQVKDPKFPQRPSLVREVDEKLKGSIKNILINYKDRGIPLEAISFEPEGSRIYSKGHIAPQVVGFTQRDKTGDNKGTIGAELRFDEYLRGNETEYKTRTSAVGLAMEPAAAELLDSTYGHNVTLTIDENIQAVTQEALAQGVDAVKGDRGVAVVYSVKTGEMLAIANYPSFNLKMLRGSNQDLLRNRAISDEIEPGSVMKILTFLALFDEGKAQPTDIVDCHYGTYTMRNGRVIRDVAKRGILPLNEAFQLSSNIATIKLASRLSEENYYHHLKAYGLGGKTGLDLPGEAPGMLRHYKQWDGYSMSSIPMGYELRITPVQAVAAVAAIGNGGWYMQPHVLKKITDHNGNIIKENHPQKLRQIADPVACQKMLALLEQVVEKGTGKTAKLDEYRVGGKTGTTKKIVNRVYVNQYIASFCGLAPINDPEVCIYVYVDNPTTEARHGGQVAGPIFREIARETLKILRVPVKNSEEKQEDINVALDTIRNKLSGRIPQEIFHKADDSEPAATGSMPDLSRMTLRDALAKISELGLKVESIKGSGIVLDQFPGAYETIEEGSRVKLVLGSEMQRIKNSINEIKASEGLSNSDKPAETAQVDEKASTATVGLALNTGDDLVMLEVTDAPIVSKPNNILTSTKKPRTATETPYPDMDPRANKTPNIQAAKRTWDEFEKKQKEQEKLRKEGKLDLLENDEFQVANDADAKNTSSEEFYSVPPPEIDGTEDIDIDNTPINPIHVRVQAPQQEQVNKKQFSVYNM